MDKDYKKLYKEALERAKYLKENTDSVGALDISTCFEQIFPELRESEDERIREELLDYIKRFIPHHDIDLVRKSKVWISWLEKQGEQKSSWSKEDENMWLQIINEMEAIKSNSSTIFEKNIAQDKIDWLKSIKPNHWKPSEEQMQALIKRTKGLHTNSETRKVLESLIFDLQETL